MEKYTQIRVEDLQGVRHIRIERPQVNNKLSVQCMNEMERAIREAQSMEDNRAIVLSGGEEWFCAGGELGDFRKKSILEIKEFGTAFINLHLAMRTSPRPIIAAVEGKAFGGGCSLVDACDLAVAGEGAEFAVPEILDGLAPAMGFSGLFAALTKKRAMALGLLGEKLSARQAMELGLINTVAGQGKAVEVAQETAQRIAGYNPTAVKMFKELYCDMEARAYENRLRTGQAMMIALFKSEDGMESLTCKEEGRPPVWSGK